MASAIADNFTETEIKHISAKHPKIVIGPVDNPNADGSFQARYKKGDRYRITIDDVADESAIAHEFIHLMRDSDKSRKDLSKTVYRHEKGGLRSLSQRGTDNVSKSLSMAEEMATTAEATVRVKKPSARPSSYFLGLVKVEPYTERWKREKEMNYHDDRKTLRTYADGSGVPDGRSIKGNNAIAMFERNYPRSLLSRRELGGSTAINISKEALKSNGRRGSKSKRKRPIARKAR